jgi:hypothetical protein
MCEDIVRRVAAFAVGHIYETFVYDYDIDTRKETETETGTETEINQKLFSVQINTKSQMLFIRRCAEDYAVQIVPLSFFSKPFHITYRENRVGVVIEGRVTSLFMVSGTRNNTAVAKRLRTAIELVLCNV